MEAEIKQHITDRKVIRSKITKANNSLKFAISQNDYTKSKAVYEQLCSLFNDEYFPIHDAIIELLSDETEDLSAYATVNNMTAQQHFDSVSAVFTQAVTDFSKFSKEFLCREMESSVKLPLELANQTIQELDGFLQSQSVSVNKLLLDNASSRVANLTSLHDQLMSRESSSDYSAIVDRLSSSILTISSKVNQVQSKCISESAPQHVSFSASSSHSQSTPQTPSGSNTPRDSDSHGTPLVVVSGQGNGHSDKTLTATMLADGNNHSSTSAHTHVSYRSSMAGKYKKPEPPKFSGKWNDWSEFQARWQHYASVEFDNDFERASALKLAVNGNAFHTIKPVPLGDVNAYQDMWSRLESVYSDVSLSVQAVYDDQCKLKPVKDNDAFGIVCFANDVEVLYDRLRQIKVEGREERYFKLPVDERLRPFTHFMSFLADKRSLNIRKAERQSNGSSKSKYSSDRKSVRSMNAEGSGSKSNDSPMPQSKDIHCVIHKDSSSHRTANCSQFKILAVSEKYDALKSVHACFHCFSSLHQRNACSDKTVCTHCGSVFHHQLLCRKGSSSKNPKSSDENAKSKAVSCAHSNIKSNGTILAICRIRPSNNRSKSVTVFFDGGSDSSFITHRAAKRMGAHRGKPVSLELTKIGGSSCEVESCVYTIEVVDDGNEKIEFSAYGLDSLTSPVCQLDHSVVSELFPSYDLSLLDRGKEVDVLLGSDWFGFHPKTERANAGKHLFIMEGVFGPCLVGSHPRLHDSTTKNSILVNATVTRVVKPVQNVVRLKACAARVTASPVVEDFVNGEGLGIEVNPRCGGCKCGKCPASGHSYSFKEEQELCMIRDNLQFDDQLGAWKTSYPWIVDPGTLPDNYSAALATLARTERTLSKDKAWATVYHDQIMDMVERGVARKLSVDEVQSWSGPHFYISHLAVNNPKSQTTPVRIVFNSSQSFQGVSLNSALAKGPDSYINNLLGILLRWRENPQVVVGDIRKMYNSVYIDEVAQHCHRFLWRNLESDRPPDVFVIQRVNMGDRPAGAISTEAVYKTAAMFQTEYPRVSDLLVHSTYVDDIIDSVSTKQDAIQLATDTSLVLSKAGFKVKAWHFSGEAHARVEATVPIDSTESSVENVRVLGVQWNPVDDDICFTPSINFSTKRKGVYVAKDLTAVDIPQGIPLILTRRQVLEQTMKLFDPFGILSPFSVLAKIYLRETWSTKLGWDDALPEILREKWVSFFKQLCDVASLKYDRCLSPDGAVGKPVLIILSDGSEQAYGCAAYIRWVLSDGSIWCRLILAKCRIAPVNRISIPQMELNGAVVSRRVRSVVEAECRFSFDKVFHLVDSETILSMINKLSTKFKVYEGVRIGEIQASTDGKMHEWHWISGELNVSDWLTRGRSPEDISPSSIWWKGPSFLYQPIEKWSIKKVDQLGNMANLPGENKCVNTCAASAPVVSFLD